MQGLGVSNRRCKSWFFATPAPSFNLPSPCPYLPFCLFRRCLMPYLLSAFLSWEPPTWLNNLWLWRVCLFHRDCEKLFVVKTEKFISRHGIIKVIHKTADIEIKQIPNIGCSWRFYSWWFTVFLFKIIVQFAIFAVEFFATILSIQLNSVFNIFAIFSGKIFIVECYGIWSVSVVFFLTQFPIFLDAV